METTKALTPGQRAAATRAANRAGGISPAKNGAAVSERAAGLALELWITEHDGDKAHLSIVFRAFDPDGRPMPEGLGKGERALPFLRWEAWPEAGALVGFEASRFFAVRADADEVEAAAPLMRRLDKMVRLAREELEDEFFAQAVATLAGHFRVSAVKVQGADGKNPREAKRGAAYVTALRAGEAFLARDRKAKAA